MNEEFVNQFILKGYLQDDPSTITKGDRVIGLSLNIVTEEPLVDTHGFAHVQRTWHRVAVWNGQMKEVEGLTSGESVWVKGRINYRSYEKNGQKVYQTNLTVTEVLTTATFVEKKDSKKVIKASSQDK